MKIEKIFKKTILILIIFFGLTYSPQSPEALSPWMPKVAGKITYFNPACSVPSAVNFITVVAAPPHVGSGTWSYNWGTSYSYMYTPPAHPGQDLLGLSTPVYTPCLIPCTAGLCPIGPGGQTVLYHGSGL